MLRIALIGCGALGRAFAINLPRVLAGRAVITGVYARRAEKREALAAECDLLTYPSFEAILADKPDFVVEFAGGDAVRAYAKDVLAAGISLIAVSTGAYADEAFVEELRATAAKSGAKLYIPNGAIGGLDALRTYALRGDGTLVIENVKGPASLEGAPYLKGEPIPTDRRVTLFDGPAKEAIAGFPKNVNVAIAAAVAAGQSNARVVIISDPDAARNSHTITIENSTMKAEMIFTSKPNPANPKSSTSAAWSVIALLDSLTSPVCFF